MGMFLRRGIPAARGTPLGDIDVGTLVKLNENGTPVEFYVAKHDYESSLNGSGRTLLVRKDTYHYIAFNNRSTAYAGGTLDSWLNGTYLGLLNNEIQDAVGATKFYYTIGNGDKTMSTLQRAVFQLSATELGATDTNANAEGSTLSIASTLQIAYANGITRTQWTRSPNTHYTSYVFYLTSGGKFNSDEYSETNGSRPCFTLPAEIKVGDDMLITG